MTFAGAPRPSALAHAAPPMHISRIQTFVVPLYAKRMDAVPTRDVEDTDMPTPATNLVENQRVLEMLMICVV
jgi:hypothetical protein